ncbi:hypothetical protein [Geoglobus acetivorans]|uniref:CRISPR-associated protein n=1 Tax=Geoglobus acetivorans TaxID=565033 RepID=A0A0A7GB66_GEOAI|nr:hypothetical protein GACE_0192 [Geoglobus acetivorans]
MKAYITMLGRSTWALVNTYYAVLMEGRYFPDIVHIFAEDIFADELGKAAEGMRVLSEEFGISPEIQTHLVPEADFVSAGRMISELIRRLKEEGCNIAIDITAGRKALVAAALIPAVKHKMDHVFYLAVKRLESRPYMMIPMANQSLRDFVGEAQSK